MNIYLVNGVLFSSSPDLFSSSLDLFSSSPELSSSSPEFSSLKSKSVEFSPKTSSLSLPFFLLFVRLSFFFGDLSCFTGLFVRLSFFFGDLSCFTGWLSFFFGDLSCFTGLSFFTLLSFTRSSFLAGFLGDCSGPSWLRIRLGVSGSWLELFFLDFLDFGEGWASGCASGCASGWTSCCRFIDDLVVICCGRWVVEDEDG